MSQLYEEPERGDAARFHWNGTQWTFQGFQGSYVWAVGQSEVGGLTRALVLYWNGSRWTVVPSDSPGGNA